MERILEEVERDYFVNYADPEVQQMCTAVHKCLEEFCRAFNTYDKSALHIETLFPCGSMAEQTTIWLGKHNYQEWKSGKEILNGSIIDLPSYYRSIEFDNLAVLSPLTADMQTSATCTGHARITSQSKQNTLTFSELRKERMAILSKAPISGNNTRLQDGKRESEYDVQTLQETDNTELSNKESEMEVFDSEEVFSCETQLQTDSLHFEQDMDTSDNESSESSENSNFQSISERELIFESSYREVISEFYETVRAVAVDNDVFQQEMELGKCSLEFTDSDKVPVLFVWISKSAFKQNKVIAGKIDFIPAFKTTHLPFDTFIVGKRCAPHENTRFCNTSRDCDYDCSEQCWRISQSHEEIRLIRNTHKHHRDLYRFIKVICDKISKHCAYSESMYSKDLDTYVNLPKSYHIKTSLIQHIKHCSEDSSQTSKCFKEMLYILKESVDKNAIQNWKGTFSITLDIYESYVYSLLSLLFSHLCDGAGTITQSDIDDMKNADLPAELENVAFNLMKNVAVGKFCYEKLLTDLTNILSHVLWDLAFKIFELNCDLVAEGRCDILLETVANVYRNTSSRAYASRFELKEIAIKRCHSETDITVLEDFFDEKNFDKNWERIYLQSDFNHAFDQSFTQQIKYYKLENEIIPSDFGDLIPCCEEDEKEDLITMIKNEKPLWKDRFWKSFANFKNAND